MQKLLFLCSQNRRRSLTAEKIFHGYQNCKASSAGTESNARIKVTAGMIGWADIIFCMEKKHVRRLKEKYADEIRDKKIICLNIPDEYENMDEELQEILMSSVEEYLE
ncbi:MAG: protein tyrosine phosphatase [Lachnospiraceae bacterium]|nr:protein tyrosine phosphatase [Lachnospiraceae bacterium]